MGFHEICNAVKAQKKAVGEMRGIRAVVKNLFLLRQS